VIDVRRVLRALLVIAYFVGFLALVLIAGAVAPL
jgi:hypothetical protein